MRSLNSFCLLAAACLSMLTTACSEAHRPQYVEVTVDTPFAMEPLKQYIFPERDFLITDFGASADSAAINTQAIAQAIEACHAAGGGRVVIPPGSWRTGSVHLLSGVNLHLSEGAVLRFTDNPDDYLPAVPTSWEGMECYNYSPLIYADGQENIAITGSGTLMPDMDNWRLWFPRPQAHLEALKQLYTYAAEEAPVEERQMAVGENHMRPHLIQFNHCRNILLDGFSIRESPFWTIHMRLCEGGIVRNLDVNAHGHNNDGIDIEMSRNFLVEDCTFDQGDDAVVIKAGTDRDGWRINQPSENIVIRRCTIADGHTLLGIGSECSAGVRNVYMTQCTAPGTVHRLFFIKTNHRRGGFVENIYMDSIQTGGTLRVAEIDTDVLYQWRKLVPTYKDSLTHIDGIHLSHIRCQGAKRLYELKGDPRLPIGQVELTDIYVDTVTDTLCPVVNVDGLALDNVGYGKVDPAILPQLDPYESNK